MLATKAKIAHGGRLIIPAGIRKKMDIHVGDEVILKFEEDALKIFNLKHAVKEAQTTLAKYNKKKVLLSEELITERRLEVKNE